MRMFTLAACAIGAGLMCSQNAMADVANGRNLAERWCASCHVTSAGQRLATEAPPFASIANRGNIDAARLAYFLMNPHPVMPNMALTRNEAADLAAYIMSLKTSQ